MTLDEVYKLLETKNIEDKIPYSHKIKTNSKVKQLSIGRVWFNVLTPDNFRLIDEPIPSNKLREIIKEVHLNYTASEALDFINKLNKEAFKLGTIYPSTFDINSLIIPEFIIEKKNELLIKNNPPPEEFNKISKELANEYLEFIKQEYGSGIYDILMSGAKKPEEWALLMIAKGSQVDIEGNVSDAIINSLDDGLTIEQFYETAAAARSTFFIRSQGSAQPGYLSSQTVYSGSDILMTSDDCKTKKYLKLNIVSSMVNNITGRYYLNESTNKLELIDSIEKAKKLVNTIIKLRSPIYCKQPDGICKTCYGELADKLNTKKIGLVAGAVVNKIGVGAAMKVRHNTSQVNIKKANFIQDIIVN